MKKRGLASPDNGDALALTFAYPVMPSNHRPRKSLYLSEYNPYALTSRELSWMAN
jgi:hypothetical protein